jgi:hypothetical protein
MSVTWGSKRKFNFTISAETLVYQTVARTGKYLNGYLRYGRGLLELRWAWPDNQLWNSQQISKAHSCEQGMWKLFSITLLVEVEIVILKYESSLHFLKSSVRRRKRSPHALARLAGPGGAGRRARGTCVNGPLKSGSSSCGSAVSFCSFSFLFLGLQVAES